MVQTARLLMFLAIAGAASSAYAATIFTDQAGFLAANSGTTLTNFDDPSVQGCCQPGLLNIGPLQFTGSSFYVGPSYTQPYTGFLPAIVWHRFGNGFDLAFAPSTAIGFYLFGGLDESQSTLTFKRGTTTILSLSRDDAIPFLSVPGTDDPRPFVYFGISGIGTFDNIHFIPGPSSFFGEPGRGIGVGAVSLRSAVPEPASWALLIAGFGLTGAAQRRRRTTITA